MTAIEQNSAIVIKTLAEAKEVLRMKEMRQGLYDVGAVVMADVLVNLHGEAHRNRRRLENRLFRRETLQHYERDLFPGVIKETLAPYIAQGSAELVSFSHQMMMNLAALNAGVDRRDHTAEETHRLYGYMMKFIEAATMAHSTGDRDQLNREVQEALHRFDEEFLQPSIARRTELIERNARGEVEDSEVPSDVLMILLRNEDHLQISDDTILREIAFFLLAGAHTSATSFTRTIHHIFEWIELHPEDRGLVRSDRTFVQRCVLETVRLNPSSPVTVRRALEDVTLQSGEVIHAGDTAVIDLIAVNRDTNLYGADAQTFNPRRELADGVTPYGLSFGHGMHACIGQELATGRESADADGQHEYGLIATAVQAMFDAGVEPDPEQSPVIDSHTARPYWSDYSVVFNRSRRTDRA